MRAIAVHFADIEFAILVSLAIAAIVAIGS